jgi:hypothetical protein
MADLDLDADRPTEPCLMDGCAQPRVEGFHCQAHADWLANRETPAARAVQGQVMAKASAQVQEHVEQSRHKAAAEPDLCISPECRSPRAPGAWLCVQHDRQVEEHHARTGTPRPPGPGYFQQQAEQARPKSAQIVCPHCQVRGQVTTRHVRQKKGVSGGKATGAIFTLGISLLATGRSRKEKGTEMRCGNCGTVWHV